VRRLTTLLIAAAVIAGGCGGDEPEGPLAEALAEIGGGGANGSLGVSWVEPGRLENAGRERLITTILAPNADTVIEGAELLERRYDFDPLAAERMVSLGGSYAFGLRLDGVDGRGLADALIAEGGASRTEGDVDLVEIGEYAVVPDLLLEADVNGLGAFDALGAELSVLAISDRARSALLGEGDRLLDEPAYAAAAECLGEDVVAARMVPDKQLLGTEVGIDLAALGVTDSGDVLCVIGPSPQRAGQIEAALRTGLAPEARDPVTNERIGQTIASAEVARETFGDVEVVRAALELAPGTRPGALLSTISTGSLVSLINGDTESPLP